MFSFIMDETGHICNGHFHTRIPRIGNKAIRMGKWKGIITDIRKGNTQMQLYNLETDIREEHDVAAQHPDIVKRFERLMKEARNGPDF